MMQTIKAAPVKKTVLVNAPQARAFDVFAARFDTWWPRDHHIGNAPMKEAIIELKPGGRWYEKCEDGSECDWGKVIVHEPLTRLALSWHLNSKFQYDESVASEVDVRFIAESPSSTRVELEHHIEATDAADIRAAVDSPQGWGTLLGIYAQQAQG